MPISFSPTRVTQFTYFDQILERSPWEGHKILDFGGNTGLFLEGAGDSVKHADYWCMDIHKLVIEQGIRTYPDAHFVHFDRYSSEFNPLGIRNLAIPDCGAPFDQILAFSVFTHIHQAELVELIAQLRRMLRSHGLLVFTFTVPSYDRRSSDPTLVYDTGVRNQLLRNRPFYPTLRDEDIDSMVEAASESPWCVLIENELHLQPGDHSSHKNRCGIPDESYCAYYSVDYMASLFPEGKVPPSVPPEWQHCCVLEKT